MDIRKALLPILFFTFSTHVFAEEITGKVTEVSGMQAKISLESGSFPNVGDPVKISSEVPGIGEVPLKGNWEVTGVTEDFITAEPDGEAAKPKTGQSAVITSDSPRNRARYQQDTAFLEAAHEGDLEFLRRALEGGTSVNVKGSQGSTALGRAAGQGHLEVVKELLQAGAEVAWEARGGQIPLLVAAFEGHARVVRILVEGGADVHQQSRRESSRFRGATALLLAARNGHVGTVRILLELGAQAGVKNARDETALILASGSGQSAVVQALLSAGADANQKGPQGATALMFAAANDHPDTLWALIDGGADLEAKTSGDLPDLPPGSSALMLGASLGSRNSVSVLLAAGASPESRNGSGQTAQDLASAAGRQEIVELLQTPDPKAVIREAATRDLLEAVQDQDAGEMEAALRLGGDPNSRDSEGATLLMVASAEGREQVVSVLIRSGADVNARYQGEGEGAGWTALMAAALQGYLGIVSQLLAAGADSALINDAGQTAADIADSQGHREVVRLLQSAR